MEYDDAQHQVMIDNTIVKFGISVGPANGTKEGNTTRVVSQQRDNTIRNICVAVTAGAGLTHTFVTMINQIEGLNLNADEAERIATLYNGKEDEFVKYIDSVKAEGEVTPEGIRALLMSEIATQANAGEQQNLSHFGTASHLNEGYVQADSQLNENIKSAVDSAKDLFAKNPNMSYSELLDLAQDEIKKSGVAQNLAGQELTGKNFSSGVDHAANAMTNLDSVEGKEYEASLIGKLANIMKKLEEYKPGDKVDANVQRLKNNFFGPIMTAISGVMYKSKDAHDNHEESKYKKQQDQGMEL